MDQNPKTKQKIQPHSTPKQKLMSSIARNQKLMNNITSFGCVLKSWRSIPLKCTPDSKSNHLSFPGPKLVEISDEKDHKNHIIKIPFHINYPCWNRNVPFKLATLSSQLNDPNGCNVMVITGISCPAFAFFKHRKNEKAWILEDCKEKERYGVINQSMKFTNCIGFRGKLYALSLQGTVVVIEEDEDEDCRFRVSRIGESRAVPTGVSRQFREYLVELNGEILLVFLVSRKSIGSVEGVEVFSLDFGKLLWVKVESLGCMALFLEDECRMGVNASELGCRENCIYFTHSRVKGSWYVYEMERDEISEWCLAK